MSGYLIDTNIFSEIFKANREVSDFVAHLDAYIDTTIFIECLQGSKSNEEKVIVKRLLSTFPLLPINATVSDIALNLIDIYSNSHGLLLADALIAGSALSADLILVTFNISDFHFIDGLSCIRPG